MDFKSNEIIPIEYSCNGKTLTFIKPLVMAIVNLTPDSFYDGGKFDSVKDILRDIEEKVALGADIVDIGAASSRPNAPEITAEEEWRRLNSCINEIRKAFPAAFLSVDTYRAEIAKRCAEAGADIINDISGGKMDAQMADMVVKLNLPYVLMHLDGTPQSMPHNQPYVNVVNTVKEQLTKKINEFSAKGFHKLILDPGFGFGKSLQNNYELLKGLGSLCETGLPLLAGVSRKSMINRVIGTNPVTALNGTTVLNTIALLNGASVLRVHDVTEARQAIELVKFYKNA